MLQVIVKAQLTGIYGYVNSLVLGLCPRTRQFTDINPCQLCSNRLHAIYAYKRQTCAEHLRERPKTGRYVVYFPKENGGWWVGPKYDCLLVSLRLDQFCDTTSTFLTPNLTVEDTASGCGKTRKHNARAQRELIVTQT